MKFKDLIAFNCYFGIFNFLLWSYIFYNVWKYEAVLLYESNLIIRTIETILMFLFSIINLIALPKIIKFWREMK